MLRLISMPQYLIPSSVALVTITCFVIGGVFAIEPLTILSFYLGGVAVSTTGFLLERYKKK